MKHLRHYYGSAIFLTVLCLIIFFHPGPSFAQDVEVKIKTPRLISFASSWIYFFGEYSPQISFMNQQIENDKGQSFAIGLGHFAVPNRNTTAVSADLRLLYRRTNGTWNTLSTETAWDSLTVLLGPRFFSEKGSIKYTFAALIGCEMIDIQNFRAEVELNGGLGLSLSKDSALLFEAQYHPISKKVGDYELKPYFGLSLKWLIFIPEHERWTTDY